MILVIGEILYDLFPTYRRIGGAPFNFAFHLKQLGFDVRFVSRVGEDELGRGILDFLAGYGFARSDIQRDPDRPTGTVNVAMAGDGSHSFSIVPDTAYDNITFDRRLRELCAAGPEMVYFGTLIQRTAGGHRLIQSLLDSLAARTLKFCDINLRPGCYTRDVLEASVSRADILKLSHEELDELVPENGNSLQQRAAALLGPPGPRQVILTCGEHPSIWTTDRGASVGPSSEDMQSEIADTVGAGDAYAAMAAAARLAGLADGHAMAAAHEFASGICRVRGALPEDPDFYTPFLSRLSHDNR